MDDNNDKATPRPIAPATPAALSTPPPNTRDYPTPPSSDETRSTANQQRMPAGRPNYYPDSAFGPGGPDSSGPGVQAAQTTVGLVANGHFSDAPTPQTQQSSSSTPRSSGSPAADGERERATSPQLAGGPSGPQFFSSPPIPVFHQQPQSVMSYYPSPHHQAQLWERHNNMRMTAGGPQVDPALIEVEPPSVGVGGHERATSQAPLPSPPPPPPNQSPPPPTPQFLQGGVIYTPDASELGLHSLSDGPPGEKPPYPYPTIIRCAILGSPRQRLTLSEIYIAMENRYPWFKTAGQGWKNSVRHNLSLNKCFAKVPRPITEPGKGAYWTVDLEAGEGNKRPRKRNKKPKKTVSGGPRSSQMVVDEDDDEDGDDYDEDDVSVLSDPSSIPSIASAGAGAGGREGYTYPPPAPPSGRSSHYRTIAPAPMDDGSRQGSNRVHNHRDHRNYHEHERERSHTNGILTATQLGGQSRRVPLGPVGSVEEGRGFRRILNDDSD